MKISDAIKRLCFTISKQNKPNGTDADALNSIIDFMNLSNDKVIKENNNLAKMYCFLLRSFLVHYKDIDFSTDIILKDILNKNLDYHLQMLQIELQNNELSNYVKSLNLKPTWEVGQNLEEIKENINENKKVFKNINIDEFNEIANEWSDILKVEASFQYHFNLTFNLTKNV